MLTTSSDTAMLEHRGNTVLCPHFCAALEHLGRQRAHTRFNFGHLRTSRSILLNRAVTALGAIG